MTRAVPAWILLQIGVKGSPGIDITVGLHHCDRAARYVPSAEPHHPANPSGHRRRIKSLSWSERIEVARQNVECESAVLTNQLLLYSVEQPAQFTGSLSLAPFREPRSKVKNEYAGKAFGKGNLEQRMSRARWMTPRILDNADVAQESRRVRDSRSPILESGKLCDLLYDNRISRFLKRDNVRTRGLDDLGDYFGAPDAALANVVSEEAHS